jgi:hypothetical protein
MRRGRNRAVLPAIAAAGCLAALSVWAPPAFAHEAHVQAVGARTLSVRVCHRTKSHSCPKVHATQSVTGSSGGLTVTFTETSDGTTANFDITWSDTQAQGAVGPVVLSYGDGTVQGFGTPEYCLAYPVAVSGDRQISYTYGASGTYSASVTVGANCTPGQVTLTLPVSIG